MHDTYLSNHYSIDDHVRIICLLYSLTTDFGDEIILLESAHLRRRVSEYLR